CSLSLVSTCLYCLVFIFFYFTTTSTTHIYTLSLHDALPISSNNADVFAYAAAKVKKGLEVGKELGAENYVFWGGRKGYETLLNRSEEHTSELQSRFDLVCRLLLEKKKKKQTRNISSLQRTIM